MSGKSAGWWALGSLLLCPITILLGACTEAPLTNSDEVGGLGGEAGAPSDEEAVGGAHEPEPAPTPSLLDVEPARAQAGDEITIEGAHFLPDPRVVLDGDTVALSTPPVDDRLTFVVPASAAPKECEQQLSLSVQNPAGTSNILELTTVRGAPVLEPTPSSVAAGTAWTLTGSGLAGARATIDGTELLTRKSDDTHLNVLVPRETPQGPQTLIVSGDCGDTTLDVAIGAPPPQLLAVDLASVAVGGVLFLDVELTYGASVAAVRIGDQLVPSSDPSSFLWSPDDVSDEQRTLGVRVPQSVSLGDATISLVGADTESEALRVRVVGTVGGPEVSPAILFPPSAFGDSYPIGTSSSFLHEDVTTGKTGNWSYDLRITRVRTGEVCDRGGTIAGYERCCAIDDNSCPHNIGCAGTELCNPLSGEYHVDANSNLVKIQIDRGEREGPEEFIGGWANAGQVPANSTVPFLVLRSQRTGRFLTIHHRFAAMCLSY